MIAEVTNGKSETASWFLDSKIAKSSLVSYLAQISTLNIHICKKNFFEYLILIKQSEDKLQFYDKVIVKLKTENHKHFVIFLFILLLPC